MMKKRIPILPAPVLSPVGLAAGSAHAHFADSGLCLSAKAVMMRIFFVITRRQTCRLDFGQFAPTPRPFVRIQKQSIVAPVEHADENGIVFCRIWQKRC